MVPAGDILPIFPAVYSVNQKLPSGPWTTESGWLADVVIAYSLRPLVRS